MTLTEVITFATKDNFKVCFQHEPFNLVIKVAKWGKDKKVNNYGQYEDILLKRESWLPYSDHAYESKISDCIWWMVEELQKEMGDR